MKSNNTPQLREKSVDELHTRERELSEQLFKLRFQRATGRMESPAKMRQVRREIARIKTLLNEKAESMIRGPLSVARSSWRVGRKTDNGQRRTNG